MKLVLQPTPLAEEEEEEQNYVPKLPLGTSDTNPEAFRPQTAVLSMLSESSSDRMTGGSSRV
jgi:hypothetical protein